MTTLYLRLYTFPGNLLPVAVQCTPFLATLYLWLYTLPGNPLPVAVSERGAEGLEAGDVAGQLEDAEDPQDPEDLSSLGDVLERVLGGEEGEGEGQVEGQDAQQVDDVEK